MFVATLMAPHPNAPTVRLRRRRGNNKTRRAWPQLERHRPEPNDAGWQVAQTTKTQAQHHRTTHNHRGEPAPAPQASP